VSRLPAPSYLPRVNVCLPEIRTYFQPDLLVNVTQRGHAEFETALYSSEHIIQRDPK
jgi:hypothetical protein